jgi:hypothetical protein
MVDRCNRRRQRSSEKQPFGCKRLANLREIMDENFFDFIEVSIFYLTAI